MHLFRNLFASGARPAIPEVDASTARQWQQDGNCVLIDVREDREYRGERIPGTHLAPLSRLERSLPSVASGKKAVFLCQSGGRTRMQAGRLASCGLSEAYILRGGLMGWKASGFPTEQG
ncbi:MAG TPA: rhodanese-like domain-containing protein [Bradyrhizobium sp.]|nr:rhodanese-like domain-containing protein [Bradyrhizobium sp.]